MLCFPKINTKRTVVLSMQDSPHGSEARGGPSLSFAEKLPHRTRVFIDTSSAIGLFGLASRMWIRLMASQKLHDSDLCRCQSELRSHWARGPGRQPHLSSCLTYRLPLLNSSSVLMDTPGVGVKSCSVSSFHTSLPFQALSGSFLYLLLHLRMDKLCIRLLRDL